MKSTTDLCASPSTSSSSSAAPSRPKVRRLHKEVCGMARMEYDGYDDVREACERKLAEWERQGIVAPYQGFRAKDWLFQ